jgi:lytic murein transglycosylase
MVFQFSGFRPFRLTLAGAALLAMSGAAMAEVPCRTSGSFENWLAGVKKEARAQGISAAAIAQAEPYMTYEQKIVNIDRGQRVFTMTFIDFANRIIPPSRVAAGEVQMKKHAATFARAEKEYGTPASVITAFWGLESDYGSNMGNDNSIRSITTLAYDCRRAEMFREHLFNSLRLIQRGDLKPSEMIGSWAGELGQSQMMPTEYLKYAVDYDKDGHRNLLRSVDDVIGSTANYLVHLGWKRGEPWLQEVKMPKNFPWKETGLDVKHTRSEYAKLGVRYLDGRPLPNGSMQTSILMPMGHLGPAFIVYDNFQVYLTWNNSLVYSTSAAYFATRLDGAPPMQKPVSPIPSVTPEQAKEIQELLTKAGYDVGGIDGKLGLASRGAIKAMQLKFGMPADSYATPELLERLKAGK